MKSKNYQTKWFKKGKEENSYRHYAQAMMQRKKDMLEKNSKIYVAGHNGLVGSAIWNNLLQRGYTYLVGRNYWELDFTDQVAARRFFDE